MSSRAVGIAALVVPLYGCGGDATPAPCTASGDSKTSVVTFATFAKQLDSKAVEGLDIDGVVSDGSDEAGCYQVDFVAPDGTAGIDNQIASLLPLVEGLVGEGNIDVVLSTAIRSGQMLILMAVRGLDDPMNDACVDVAFGTGSGIPYLDTGGKYLPYQTFAWTRGVSVLYRGRIDGGVLSAGPGNITIPVQMLDAKFNLSLHHTRIRMLLTADPRVGGATVAGLVAGGIEVTEIAAAIKDLNIGDSVKGAVVPLLASKADLGRRDDGLCHQISTALRFETTAAFVIGE